MTTNILIKGVMAETTGSLALAGNAKLGFKAKPMMPSITPETGGSQRGLRRRTEAAIWHELELQGDTINPWDACHAAVGTGLGLSGGAHIEFAEPDMEQQWMWGARDADFNALQGQCGTPVPQKGAPFERVEDDDLWFLNEGHSGLLAAREALNIDEAAIRIAHLDTGFDPDHVSRPRRLRTDLARNFVEGGDCAIDRPGGVILPNHGHGVATLALLAGNEAIFGTRKIAIGGAANFEVVPIRVSKSVVLFKTSAIARAFDYIHGLSADPATRCHVITMSMGGLASRAWADAVNALYDKGIFIVTAAGNNYNDLPTHFLVYPARFRRVMAACGVMAHGSPYTNLKGNVMQGNYGPQSRMDTAISAFTPNVPWAKFGCRDQFDRDGGGTSSATPQIAAAAALWMQKNIDYLETLTGDEAWQRVELVRAALQDSAASPAPYKKELGAGKLRARSALELAPADIASLTRQKKDTAAFGLIRLLLGLGIEASATTEMLELEALQITQRSRDLEQVLDDLGLDPEDNIAPDSREGRQILAALADSADASGKLKSAIFGAGGSRTTTSGTASARGAPATTPQKAPLTVAAPPPGVAAFTVTVPKPEARNLRVYSIDPSISTNLDYFHLRERTLPVRWEDGLMPGPVGEYLEVVDIDPPASAAYAPVDLNAPYLLAQNGLAPSEGNPQFHQQMVYAVCMQTIETFERALGRPALWSEQTEVSQGTFQSNFVRRLRVYPHALREPNAYYSPVKKALLFGYFNAKNEDVGDELPGGLIFTCLSHDIVAHEMSHALLDGLHPRFGEPTNDDMLAFHEAFADIVALFQHFMMDDVLAFEITRTRGDLTLADMLGGIAAQFGQAIGNRGALRNAIAEPDEHGVWRRVKPKRSDYTSHTESHARGAVLVSAVFDAFLRIYQREAEVIIKVATGGSGVLPHGDLAPGLAAMLAKKASQIAMRVLNVCIRALDYCPPVDLTFGEYLRAIVTADSEIVPDDRLGYRIAFISAFRDRGIYPPGVTNLSETTLKWRPPLWQLTALENTLQELIMQNRTTLMADWSQRHDRLQAYQFSNSWAQRLHTLLMGTKMTSQEFQELGLVKVRPSVKAGKQQKDTVDNQPGWVSPIEVHSVRTALRIGPGGRPIRELIIELTQKWRRTQTGPAYRGGCTIIFDPDAGQIKFVIRKRLGSRARIETEEATREALRGNAVFGTYFSDRVSLREPFALTHRH